MTIREIDEQILQCIDEETGEVDAERLAGLQMERDRKIESVADWILENEASTQAITTEIERLQKLREQRKKRVEQLKGFLRFALEDQNYSGVIHRITFRRSQSVKDMTDEQVMALPDEFKTVKTVTTVKPDKVAIKAAIRDGWQIAGVEIEEKVSVTIK